MDSSILFRQAALPVFQNKIYKSSEEARLAVLGDVELIQEPVSGLVHNQAFDESLLIYDRDYQNEQACSPTFRTHLGEVLDIVLRNVQRDDIGVEIGCGKGYFFELMCQAGANLIGYDPAYQGSNSRVVREHFGTTPLAFPPDYIVLRHVLEHIQSPWQFLGRLAVHCKANTKIYIEVPCFSWIVEHSAFYDIFYEHVNYFTLEVLTNAFSRRSEAGHLFGGQYLFVIADLQSFAAHTTMVGTRFGPLQMDAYLANLLRRRQNRQQSVYIWGAGAKGVTFSNILVRNGVEVEALIDINPAKQGRYSGGTGLPIISPDGITRRFDPDVFVMNPVYLPEIHAMAANVNVNANLIPVA